MIQKTEKKQKKPYYRRRNKMARTQNEKDRDVQIVNALAAILSQLESLNKNIGKLSPNTKGK